MKQIVLSVLLNTICIHAAGADDVDYQGPYFGEVTRIVDGDTFEATIRIWPTINAQVSVRLFGVDAPETYRPNCETEAFYGRAAKVLLERELPIGAPVRLENVSLGSFSGRVLVDVARLNESRATVIPTLLLKRGLALGWKDGDDPIPWCALAGGPLTRMADAKLGQ